MSLKKHDREYDIVLFGATGYTGLYTAEHITKHLPTDLKWAIAGRTPSKLQQVIDECQKLNPDRVAPKIETANIESAAELDALAKKTFILLTTVGPYSVYGEPVVKACAENGTHYIDVTGEFPWVHDMIKKYEPVAKESGACLFPQAGLESTPPDLCTYVLARKLKKELGAQTGEVTINFHTLIASPSGGTIASFLNVFERYGISKIQAASAPYASSPIPHASPARPPAALTGVYHDPVLGLMAICPTGGVDASVVERTWGLFHSYMPGREDEFYGENFRWRELSRVNWWMYGLVKNVGVAIGGALLAFLPPLRAILSRVLTQPGGGPTREQIKRERFEFQGVAEADGDEHKGKKAFVRATWQGGMYDVTGMFMAQGALTLLQDNNNGELGLNGGFYTPACLGQGFVDRCIDHKFNMEVKMVEGTQAGS